jgi:hypothetical protein
MSCADYGGVEARRECFVGQPRGSSSMASIFVPPQSTPTSIGSPPLRTHDSPEPGEDG